MQHTLEGSRWFTPVAWTLVICFALFTGKLALDLQKTVTTITELPSQQHEYRNSNYTE